MKMRGRMERKGRKIYMDNVHPAGGKQLSRSINISCKGDMRFVVDVCRWCVGEDVVDVCWCGSGNGGRQTSSLVV